MAFATSSTIDTVDFVSSELLSRPQSCVFLMVLHIMNLVASALPCLAPALRWSRKHKLGAVHFWLGWWAQEGWNTETNQTHGISGVQNSSDRSWSNSSSPLSLWGDGYLKAKHVRVAGSSATMASVGMLKAIKATNQVAKRYQIVPFSQRHASSTEYFTN